MISYQHTLALVDNHSPAQFALNKALQLAYKTKAKVTALKVERPYNNILSRLGLIPNNALDPMLFVNKLLSKFQHLGVNIEVKVIKNVKDHVAILEETNSGDYDLVVINNQHHNSIVREFISSCEAHLLRESQLPILIVGNKGWQRQGHILTALETAESNIAHKALNQNLLDDTQQLASLLENDIHLLNCYQLKNWSMSVNRDQTLFTDAEQRSLHWNHLLDSAKPYQLDDDHLHLEQGLPDHVIPEIAHKCNANLLVIGAGEHHGFMSELKGHTSSVIIDQLKCDILAIKPVHH
ncbi:universal stress protein [Shewanella abyssi]|uniref:universal stress protein n=1 Tax=Shewanella abyssi TaxID=311789 RepID=UPI00200D4F00|nr:universal stress protein [Shewanella abyssi]MCL1049083.1 universal stress protein [Shewanella abyssi]